MPGTDRFQPQSRESPRLRSGSLAEVLEGGQPVPAERPRAILWQVSPIEEEPKEPRGLLMISRSQRPEAEDLGPIDPSHAKGPPERRELP